MSASSIPKLLLVAAVLYGAYNRGLLFFVIKGVTVFWFIIVAFLFMKQEDMLYVPCPDPSISSRKYRAAPSDFNIEYSDINITSDDGTPLHGWFLKQRKAEATKKAITVLYFHANAGNISDRLQLFKEMWILTGVNIIAAEYRGYGQCGGSPSEEGLKMDALAYYKYALEHDEIDETKLVLFGRSLGGAVSVSLAAALADQAKKVEQPLALILENTFTSIPEVASDLLPILKPLKPLLREPFLRNIWATKNVIEDLNIPILFFAGLKDQIVPPPQMQLLHELCKKVPKTRMCKFPAAGHNDVPLCGGTEYYDTLSSFLKDL